MKIRLSVVCLLVLFGVSLAKTPLHHKCVHDEKFADLKVGWPKKKTDFKSFLVEQTPAAEKPAVFHASSDVVDGWHQMRIHIDLSQADKLVSENPSLNAMHQIARRLIESTRTYFQSFFQVNAEPVLKSDGGKCGPLAIGGFEVSADTYIGIYAENDANAPYFAAATACDISTRDNRPYVGVYILNFARMKPSPLYEYFYFSVFAHEFTHIIGFSSSLYPYYVIPGTSTKRGVASVIGSTTIGSETFTTLILPEVVDYARNFFGCPSLQGVPLENDGGSGSQSSHWEKLFLTQEYMNPTTENPGIISEFTLNLLRGSGWYKIDTGAAQHYDWAQGSGCSHFTICPTGPGYCTPSQVGSRVCNSEWTGQALCIVDSQFSSSCRLKSALDHSCFISAGFSQDSTEYYGPGSRCINYASSAGTSSKCHKVDVNYLLTLVHKRTTQNYCWIGCGDVHVHWPANCSRFYKHRLPRPSRLLR